MNKRSHLASRPRQTATHGRQPRQAFYQPETTTTVTTRTGSQHSNPTSRQSTRNHSTQQPHNKGNKHETGQGKGSNVTSISYYEQTKKCVIYRNKGATHPAYKATTPYKQQPRNKQHQSTETTQDINTTDMGCQHSTPQEEEAPTQDNTPPVAPKPADGLHLFQLDKASFLSPLTVITLGAVAAVPHTWYTGTGKTQGCYRPSRDPGSTSLRLDQSGGTEQQA